MLATYHTHTTFSDGKASPGAMVDAAVSAGIAEVGFSDHLTLHPGPVEVPWSMDRADLLPYVEAVRAEQRRSSIAVRLGIELDWFDGSEATLRAAVSAHPFDYVIGSVHFIGEFPVDGNPHRWKALTQDEVDAVHRGYWERIARMAASGLFTIAAHLDLPKKFGFVPRRQPQELIDRALDAIAASSMVVELNTSGWHRPCADAYPSAELLIACRARGIETTLSADAHRPEDLLRDFARGAQRLRDAGYERVARFKRGSVTFDELSAATPIA